MKKTKTKTPALSS